MRELPQAFAALGAYRQFIVYMLVPSTTRPGKTDKYPCDFRSARVVSAHDPQYWTDAGTAIAAAATFGDAYGVGFVFVAGDPFWFVDVDHCLEPNNTWSKLATDLCGALSGAAIEISQSGAGLHIIGTGACPPHGCKNTQFGLELYTQDRFVALTGTGVVGNAAVDLSHALPWLVDSFFKSSVTVDSTWTDGPAAEWRGPTDDVDLIRRASMSRSAASAFGNKASFADLWTGNIEVLAKAYPDAARAYDASSADAALAQHLAFWTGRDCARIERLMRQSALVRDKWERSDYLPRTIMAAVGQQFEVLTDREPEPVAGAAITTLSAGSIEPPKPTLVTGSTFLTIEQQIVFFTGCVYVRDIHRALVPGGSTLKPDQFKVAYGGYQFSLDAANEKVTFDAWEAFTQSRAYRCARAEGLCFKPQLPAGALVEINQQLYANSFWPVEVARKVGDSIEPFMLHLYKLYPVERDAHIMLYYMAACVQHQGVKFQWAPLVQGVEGNGKTLLTRCVAEAVGRRYTHWPKASQLDSNFNGWLLGKVFYAVEDIYVPDHRAEILETLKPMITGGDGLEIEKKGVDQISADICGNFIFNTNHKGAVRKTRNDRRFCTLFSAQQQASDLARDGMTGVYFPALYDWLRADGYAIVSEMLHTIPIPHEFNPATGCQYAPVTSTTEDAIDAGAGGIEQEISEAVAQGAPGFAGDWISSIMLERLLERIGAARRVPHNKRREMLAAMGYIYHPACKDGRVNNSVLPDGGKPRLFVRIDSEAAQLISAGDAAKLYEAANTGRIALPFAS